MKRKIYAIGLVVLMCFTIFLGGCSNSSKNNKNSAQNTTNTKEEKIKIGALKGPTGIGMVKCMEENKDKYEISLFNSPDEVVSKIVSGELDGAAVPSNLAAVLYNKTKGDVNLVGVNTLGVLYIVENGNTIKDIKDLKGKTVYSSGKGSAPEFIFNYILKKNGLEPDKDVKIEYKMQHSDLAASVASKEVKIALLPEPFVTSSKLKNKELNVPINLTEQWDKVVEDGSKLVMGAIVFRKDFVSNKKDSLNNFLKDYEKSVDFVNKNNQEAGKLAEKHGVMPKAKIAELAIPRCNIVLMQGEEAKKSIEGFLKVLFQSNPKSIGGKLPDEGFYYKNN
ncbi:ABC transporter substrate-binding protein [Haloimpatiens lingqiaonensis]|uniref:ABC transporter substrate-binding protein n=1 Tax=Haloimpatiens lingqiaonensis TaxID=1380675 RepID=UPI0010FF4E5D|nr:ABC transporter substrate-binding protein [Haloimpatiens lingqiaonensis]